MVAIFEVGKQCASAKVVRSVQTDHAAGCPLTAGDFIKYYMPCCPATIPTVKTKIQADIQAVTKQPPALGSVSTLPMQRGFSVTSNTSTGSGISLL